MGQLLQILETFVKKTRYKIQILRRDRLSDETISAAICCGSFGDLFKEEEENNEMLDEE